MRLACVVVSGASAIPNHAAGTVHPHHPGPSALSQEEHLWQIYLSNPAGGADTRVDVLHIAARHEQVRHGTVAFRSCITAQRILQKHIKC